MNIIIRSLLVFAVTLSLVPGPSVAKEATEEAWYPFSFPEKLDPNSPANIGKLVLDAPAGKHGFVKVKDNPFDTRSRHPVSNLGPSRPSENQNKDLGAHFFFEDGTRAKFWGTNLCFNANFPDKKQAVMLADRIAFFGFNAVRLHHMDFYFEPKGIFEDIAPMYKDPQMKETGTLSKTQLERLDYLIYQLKLRGIYIDMNLLVARHFTKADGVVDADKLGMAAKPVSMFDPKLIELQKQYAKDLLAHYNPYTKLRYVDDPAVALVEIINETSISRDWKNNKLDNLLAKTTHHSEELDKKWNQWLEAKYKTPETVRKSWGILGSKEKEPGSFTLVRPRFQKEMLYVSEQMRDAETFYEDIEKSYFEEMTRFLKNDLGIKVPITGSQYSSAAAQASCDFIDKHGYWDHPKFPHKTWDKDDFRINNNSLLQDKKHGIIGRFIKELPPELGKPRTITEWKHCYPNQYAYETPILLAAKANKEDWDGLFQFAFSHEGWDFKSELNDLHSFFDIIANSQQSILSALAGRLYLSQEKPALNLHANYYTVSTSVLSAASGFIKDKRITLGPFTFTPQENCTTILTGLNGQSLNQTQEFLLFTVGEARNMHSGWATNGTFNWGKGPVLLKSIPIKDMTFGPNNKPVKISENQKEPWVEFANQ